jgi:hypothetical protein
VGDGGCGLRLQQGLVLRAGGRFHIRPPPGTTPSSPAGHSTIPSHDLLPGLPRQEWKRRSCSAGAHDHRIYDWARVEVRPRHHEDCRHWVIARRSVSRPEEISYYIACCPAQTTLDQLISIAGSRWAVEECFQTAKQRSSVLQIALHRLQAPIPDRSTRHSGTADRRSLLPEAGTSRPPGG